MQLSAEETSSINVPSRNNFSWEDKSDLLDGFFEISQVTHTIDSLLLTHTHCRLTLAPTKYIYAIDLCSKMMSTIDKANWPLMWISKWNVLLYSITCAYKERRTEMEWDIEHHEKWKSGNIKDEHKSTQDRACKLNQLKLKPKQKGMDIFIHCDILLFLFLFYFEPKSSLFSVLFIEIMNELN